MAGLNFNLELVEQTVESKRAERVSDLLQREISDILLRKVKDPRLHSITITRVRTSRDLRHTRVHYSTLSGSAGKHSVEMGLTQARGFIKRELGQRIRLRYMPEIEFIWDNSFEYAAHIEELIEKVRNVDNDTESSEGN